MKSDMMVDENPMEDVGKTMPTDEFHDRFDEGRDPGLSFYRHQSTQQFDLEEVIAQALPRVGALPRPVFRGRGRLGAGGVR